MDQEISVDLYLLAGDHPRKAIARLNELRLQYPEHPRIYNYLAKAFLYIRDSEKIIEVVEESRLDVIRLVEIVKSHMDGIRAWRKTKRVYIIRFQVSSKSSSCLLKKVRFGRNPDRPGLIRAV